jgi:type IV secretion system protein VirB6
MDSLTFFQSLYTGMIVPLLTQLQGMIGAVVDVARPAGIALVALWMAAIGIEVANGHKTIQSVARDFLIAAFFIGLLQSSGIYLQWVGNLFLQVIPNSVGAAFGGQQSPAAGMDTVLNTAVGTALKTYHALPWSLAAIPLGLGIIAFLILALAACGFTFFFYVLSVFTVVIAIFVGPIFMGLAAVPHTRKFAAGWLAVVTGGVIAQVLALAVLILLSAAEGQTITQSAALIRAGDNSIDMLMGLFKCGLLMAMCGLVIYQIPGLAARMGGGVYHGVSAIGARTFGEAATAGSAATSAARGVAGAAGGNAARQIGGGAVKAMRPKAPTGPNLSNSAGTAVGRQKEKA